MSVNAHSILPMASFHTPSTLPHFEINQHSKNKKADIEFLVLFGSLISKNTMTAVSGCLVCACNDSWSEVVSGVCKQHDISSSQKLSSDAVGAVPTKLLSFWTNLPSRRGDWLSSSLLRFDCSSLSSAPSFWSSVSDSLNNWVCRTCSRLWGKYTPSGCCLCKSETCIRKRKNTRLGDEHFGCFESNADTLSALYLKIDPESHTLPLNQMIYSWIVSQASSSSFSHSRFISVWKSYSPFQGPHYRDTLLDYLLHTTISSVGLEPELQPPSACHTVSKPWSRQQGFRALLPYPFPA